MTNKPPRGGPGRNQGRKPLATDTPTVRINLSLTAEQRDKLKRLGGSGWLQKQIDAAILDETREKRRQMLNLSKLASIHLARRYILGESINEIAEQSGKTVASVRAAIKKKMLESIICYGKWDDDFDKDGRFYLEIMRKDPQRWLGFLDNLEASLNA